MQQKQLRKLRCCLWGGGRLAEARGTKFVSERCTLAPPAEYDGMICAATAHADVDRCHYCSNLFNLLAV